MRKRRRCSPIGVPVFRVKQEEAPIEPLFVDKAFILSGKIQFLDHTDDAVNDTIPYNARDLEFIESVYGPLKKHHLIS